MTKNYKIKAFVHPPYSDEAQISEFALELGEKYGLLDDFTLEEISRIYSAYSQDYYSAGWLEPTRETVEEAFGVELEEV